MSPTEALAKKRTRRSSPGDPKRGVAYLRMSTERQDLSPGAQRAAIEAWAGREGVVADPGEQATVARARELRGAGLSLRQIAAGLVAEGRRPRSGRAWAIQTIRRLVAAP